MKKSTKVVILIFSVLLVFAIVAIALLASLGSALGGGTGTVASKTILEIDFEAPIVEYIPDDPIAQALMQETLPLRDVLDGLEKAAEDERVLGLVARIGAGGLGMAQSQEVRDALIAFRKSGKPAVAFSETFGEVSPGNGGYYLASAFDEIYLQPSGDVNLTGLSFQGMFLKGTFEKMGIQPQMDHRHEYKNALNTFTETEFTPPHEEALAAVMNSMFSQMVRGIAEARGFEELHLRQLIDRGPFLGQEAVDAGLVDALAYRDQAYDRIREKVEGGEDAKLLYLSRYVERAGRPHKDGGDTIALVYGVGAVTRGPNAFSPLTGSLSMGSDTVAAALRQAIDDEKVKAIVFRVDSPGGSYVASDTIWRETVRAKAAGKPVIVSMGNVAGSGGYFVAMAADKIVAQPGTITGSIGVLGGKLITQELWNKLGVTWDEVHTSEHADMWLTTQPYEGTEIQRWQAWLDRIYADFTQKVAEGRGMPLEDVQNVAKGRIWSGEEARDRGLVDELGGIRTALNLARQAAGIPEDGKVRFAQYPAPKTPFESLFPKKPENSEGQVAIRALAGVLEEIRPLARFAQKVGLVGEPAQALAMPEVPEGL